MPMIRYSINVITAVDLLRVVSGPCHASLDVGRSSARPTGAMNMRSITPRCTGFSVVWNDDLPHQESQRAREVDLSGQRPRQAECAPQPDREAGGITEP